MANIKSITVEDWVELRNQGINVAVNTLLNGYSMMPLIRKNKDKVKIIPIYRELLIGDVVLFDNGSKYVVHRLYKIDEEVYQTWGDNCLGPDRPLKKENILGLVSEYTRDGKVHVLDSEEAREWGKKWTGSMQQRRYAQRYAMMLRVQRIPGWIKRKLVG